MLVDNLNNAVDSAYNAVDSARESVNNSYNKMTQAVKNNPEAATKVLLGAGVAMVCLLNAERIQGLASDLFCNCPQQVVCPNIAQEGSYSFFASPISSTLGAVSNGASSVAYGVQNAFDAFCSTVITYVTGIATGVIVSGRNHAQDRFVQQQPTTWTWMIIRWLFSRR